MPNELALEVAVLPMKEWMRRKSLPQLQYVTVLKIKLSGRDKRGSGYNPPSVVSAAFRLAAPCLPCTATHREAALLRRGGPFQRFPPSPQLLSPALPRGVQHHRHIVGGRVVSAPLPRGLPAPLSGSCCRGEGGVSSGPSRGPVGRQPDPP